MAHSSESSGRYIGYIVTGLISLIVAVAGGWLLNYFTEKKMSLEYRVLNSEPFSGEQQDIAISTIIINNTGKKELENIYAKITFSNATIIESKISGLPKGDSKTTQDDKHIQIISPFINPDEKVTIQLLLKTLKGKFEYPSIEVRGKGITGKDTTIDKAKTNKFEDMFLILISTATITILSMSFMLKKVLPRMFYTKKHRDDQRDVMAYILGINGLFESSISIRNLTRNWSYWSLSDFLAESWINSANKEVIRKGIKSLEDLIEYAYVADTSILLIYYNIARLYVAIDDVTSTKKYIDLAQKGKHEVIKKRIDLDNKLRTLVNNA